MIPLAFFAGTGYVNDISLLQLSTLNSNVFACTTCDLHIIP